MKRTRFLPDLAGIWAYLSDGTTDWKPKVAVVLALIYLVWPLDLIPDFAPVVGWLDDIGFIGLASWYLIHATNKYLDERDAKRIDRTG
jgi:uncharacterized membrane protein YkvA (DUF1232 family)